MDKIIKTTGIVTGPITKDKKILQKFSPTQNNLSGISLYVGTYGKQLTCNVTLTLLNERKKKIATKTLSAKNMTDNSWVLFPLTKLEDSKDQSYWLEITSDAQKDVEAVTFWANNLEKIETKNTNLHDFTGAICFKTVYTESITYIVDKLLFRNESKASKLSSDREAVINQVLEYCILKKDHYISRVLGLADAVGRTNCTLEKVLSIGCGESYQESFLAARFPDLRVHATDWKLVDAKFPLDNMTFAELNILEPDNSKELYDLVFSIECLEHVENFDLGFKNHAKYAKKGGYVYVSVPFASKEEQKDPELQQKEWENHEHYRPGFTFEDLEKACKDNNLEIVFIGNMFHENLVPNLNELMRKMNPENIQLSLKELLNLFILDIKENKAKDRSEARGIRVLAKKI